VEFHYDGLILAADGTARPPPWQVRNGRTWSIDTHADAVALDRHLASLKEGPGTDTVVIVGAGFTGLELATEMRIRLAEHLGSERAERARIILLEAAVTVSEELGPGPRPHIEAALQAAKVELRLDTTIEWIDGDRVFLNDGARITAPTVIVTTGPRANGLPAGFGLPTDPAGRLPVDKNLAVKGLRNIHAAGDIAHAMTDADHVALMSCQHAMPMGRYAGHKRRRRPARAAHAALRTGTLCDLPRSRALGRRLHQWLGAPGREH
jgi:NADH dehydrogenase